jgi:hypothetical protein
MAEDIIFFSLAGPVRDYKSQWYSGKKYAPGSPSSGLKRCILFLEISRGFSLYIINFVRSISEAAMGAGAIYFYGAA